MTKRGSLGRWLRGLPALVLGTSVMLGASMGTMAAPPEPRALPALELAPDIPVRSLMLRRAFPDHPVPPPAEERFPGQEDLPDGSFGEERRLPAVPTTECDKDIDLSGSLDGVVAITAQDNGTCTNADIDTYLAGASTYVVQAGGQEIAWTHTDVTDPANPVIVGQFYWSGSAGANTYTPDAKAFQQGANEYVALSLERMSIHAFCGVVIVNITDPATPVIESQAIGSDWCDVHNSFVETDANGDGEYIYLTADGPNDMRVLDIGGAHGGSVDNPVEIGRYIAPGANNQNYVHDITVLDHGGTVGRRVYLSYWDSGLVILDADDVTPGTSPAPIVGPNVIDPPNFKTHHAFASQDGSLVFIQDEFLKAEGDQPIQMWSVADPAAPSYVDGLALGTDVAVNPAHNLEIRDDIHPDRLYVGWYKLGLLAWDFTASGFVRYHPSPPTAVLYHQAQTEAVDGAYSGTWGVRLEVIDGQVHVFQSDRRYGLIVDRVLTAPAGNTPPVAQDDTAATSEDTPVTKNVLANDTDADGDALSVASATNGAHGAVTVNGDNTVTYTPDPNFNGIDGFTYTASDGNGGYDTAAVTVTVSPVNAVVASFESIASEDGWVRESRETSGVGGRVNTGGKGSKALRAGDDRKDRQYKFVVSFDTSSIPVGATIQSATLQLTRGGTQGTNPFRTHSPLLVDIKKGNFGSGAVLEKSDFQDTVGAAQVATISNQGSRGTVYTVDLAGGLAYINKAGRTQLRIYFARDDNDDRDSDYAGFYSSDNSDSARHPKLIVTYQE